MKLSLRDNVRDFRAVATSGSPEIRLLIAFLGIVALTLSFGLLTEEVIEGNTLAFDRTIFLFFREAGNPGATIGPIWFQEAARDITSLGSTAVLTLLVIATTTYLVVINMRANALLLLASVLGGQLLSTVLKLTIERVRPDIVADAPHVFSASFPSGHAMLSAVTYLTLGALLARIQTSPGARGYLLSLAIIIALLVGLSRVYLGVHWPTDVLAGWCLGAAWALMCCGVAFWLECRGHRQHSNAKL